MLIYFGSFSHICILLLAAALPAAAYFLLKNRSEGEKRDALFYLMLINLIQHFFKSFLWPHLAGKGFGLENTAYNVCALFIIVSPIVFLAKSEAAKRFLVCVGTVAGSLPLIIPFWFYGQSPFSWEFARAFFCHVLLLTTSLLPALFGFTRPTFRGAWKTGAMFLLTLSVVWLDNLLFTGGEKVYETMLARNPLWLVAPPEGFHLFPVFELFGRPVPLLWYAPHFYASITVLAAILGAVCDRRAERKRRPFFTGAPL